MNFRYDKPKRAATRDFHRPRQGNPMFPRAGAPRRRTARPMRPWMTYSMAGVFGLGALWYVLWSAAFSITKIEIPGVSPATEAAVRDGLTHRMEGRTLFIFPRSNLLIFDKAGALRDVSAKVMLSEISISKRLPGTLVVDAKELTARAALDWKDRLYAVDENGVIIRELSETELDQLGELPPHLTTVQVAGLGAESMDTGTAPANKDADITKAEPRKSAIPLVMLGDDQGTDAPDAKPGESKVTTAGMKLILQAHARLADVAGSRVRWYVARPASETVEAVMEGDWRVLMSSALPFDAQAERLSLVLKEKIGSKKAQLEYVDLRYNERIFFRMKGEQSQ